MRKEKSELKEKEDKGGKKKIKRWVNIIWKNKLLKCEICFFGISFVRRGWKSRQNVKLPERWRQVMKNLGDSAQSRKGIAITLVHSASNKRRHTMESVQSVDKANWNREAFSLLLYTEMHSWTQYIQRGI